MSSAGSPNSVQVLFSVAQSISRSKKAQNQLIADIENNRNSDLFRSIAGPLEALTLEDLGLRNLEHCFEPGVITLINVHSQKEMWIGVFCMTKGTRFPLHDHPDMIGLSRLIYGTLTHRSLDIMSCSSASTEARLASEGVTAAPSSFFLTPNMGNLHEVEAVEDAVLLDLFLPNYSKARVCSYFEEVEKRGSTVILRRISQPDIPCQEKAYSGFPLA